MSRSFCEVIGQILPPTLRLCGTALALNSCATIPANRATLEALDFRGNSTLGDDDIQEKIASAPSPRFLGLVSGVVYDYEVFDRYVLERDLQRIERLYQAHGFFKARVRAGRVFFSGRHTRVEIVIEEGPPVLVRRLDLHGLDGLPEPLVQRAKRVVARQLRVGRRFEEENFAEAQERLRRILEDNGYAYVTIRKAADLDLPRNFVSVGYWVTLGPLARFGDVRITGLGSLPEEPVRRALAIKRGDPYSAAELEAAEQALLELGVFATAKVEPELGKAGGSGPHFVPIHVVVEPAPLHSVHLGGGVQTDTLQTQARLIAGWENRNFLGGMRRFQIEAVPGVVLYPTRVPELKPPEHLLPQGRLRAEFRQSGFIEGRTNAIVRSQASVYPVLLSPNVDPNAPVLGYRDLRFAVGVDRSYLKTYTALTHNIQVNSPFTYLGPLDPDLGTVWVSYLELSPVLDLRDERIHPHSGVYLSTNLQAAGLGGDARDFKVQPEVRGYVPIARRVTLALRGTLGVLFASNYGGTLESNALTGSPGDVTRAAWVRDIQLLFLRGFYSGGSGSNRGYGFREIGPHGVVPFYNPGQTKTQIAANCDPNSPEYSPSNCDLPLGGLTLWEASVELRFPILGPITGAVFSDASDVSAKVANFRWTRPHLSVGLGLRYDTPVGPIRADIGYRVPGLQAPVATDEGVPQELFGLPAAISLGIGEAF